MKRSLVAVLLLVIGTAASGGRLPARAAEPVTGPAYVEAKTVALKQAFQTGRDWHVTVLTPAGPDAATGGAPVRLCFWFDPAAREQGCERRGDLEFPQQNLGTIGIVPLDRVGVPRSGVLVETYFSGGGSGIAREVTIFAYDKAGDAFTGILSLKLNEIGEYRVIATGSLAGTVISASALWQSDEGHFGAHRYYIQVLKYSGYYRGYERIAGYLTRAKYESERPDVIGRELGTVSNVLAKLYGCLDPLSR
jgi:hypothetical protein